MLYRPSLIEVRFFIDTLHNVARVTHEKGNQILLVQKKNQNFNLVVKNLFSARVITRTFRINNITTCENYLIIIILNSKC